MLFDGNSSFYLSPYLSPSSKQTKNQYRHSQCNWLCHFLQDQRTLVQTKPNLLSLDAEHLSRLQQEDTILHTESVVIKHQMVHVLLACNWIRDYCNNEQTHLKNSIIVLLSTLTTSPIETIWRLNDSVLFYVGIYLVEQLAGLPQSTLPPLQGVMNAKVHLVVRLWPWDPVTESMKVLHWLPMQYRITFNHCLMMVNGTSFAYIKDMVKPARETHGWSHLWSVAILAKGTTTFWGLNSKFRCRAFSVKAPSKWNAQPSYIKAIVDRVSFKRALMIYFFRRA